MLEELNIIAKMVGDLTGLSGWLIGGYIVYKLLVNMVLIVGGGWLIHKVSTLIYKFNTADITKREAKSIKYNMEIKENQHKMNKRDWEEDLAKVKDDLSKAKREAIEVKHMYKILKEATNESTTGSSSTTSSA